MSLTVVVEMNQTMGQEMTAAAAEMNRMIRRTIHQTIRRTTHRMIHQMIHQTTHRMTHQTIHRMTHRMGLEVAAAAEEEEVRFQL